MGEGNDREGEREKEIERGFGVKSSNFSDKSLFTRYHSAEH